MPANGSQELPDELTHGLCSHSGKTYSIREMGRYLSPIYIIFRAGWEMRNAHTMFDYLVKDVHHDITAAKLCAGSTIKWFDEIWGVYNSSIADLKVELDQFDSFCCHLFKNQAEVYVTLLVGNKLVTGILLLLTPSLF